MREDEANIKLPDDLEDIQQARAEYARGGNNLARGNQLGIMSRGPGNYPLPLLV